MPSPVRSGAFLLAGQNAAKVWLTRLQAVGVGERVGTTVKSDIYALK